MPLPGIYEGLLKVLLNALSGLMSEIYYVESVWRLLNSDNIIMWLSIVTPLQKGNGDFHHQSELVKKGGLKIM